MSTPCDGTIAQTEIGRVCLSSSDRKPLQCPTGSIESGRTASSLFCQSPSGIAAPVCPPGYRRDPDGTPDNACQKATPVTETQTQRPPSSSFSTLDATYQQQVAAYEALLQETINNNRPSRANELRAKSEEIQNTLHKMIENVTYLKKDTPDIRAQRDSLLEKLRRIQQDYSAMIVNTDDLETLRRIREQENGEAHRQLLLYLMAFLFMTMLLLVYLMYAGRSADATPTTTATPAMSAALT